MNRLTTCLACGERIAPSLAVGASLRCHDCRDAHTPLRWDLVELPVQLRPAFELPNPFRKAA
jgi:hypothetical protein